MKKIENKWIVEVWDNQAGKNVYLVCFGNKLTPLLSDMRNKARKTTREIAEESARLVKKQTGKIARVILK